MAEHDPQDPRDILETTADLGPEAPEATPEDRAAFEGMARALACASPLTRRYCPSPQDLIATDRALGSQKAELRQNHIAACPLCRDDLADYRALEVVPEPALVVLKARVVIGWRAAQEAVARALDLIETTLEAITPAPVAAVRSTAHAAPPIVVHVPFGDGKLELCWQGDDEGIDLQVQALTGAPKAYRLALSPRKTEGTEAETETEAEAKQWRPGVWESRSSDDQGRTSISGLAAGDYVLTVYGPQQRQPDIEVELRLDI